MKFSKEEAVKKMYELADGRTIVSAECADAILKALGKNPRDFYAADAGAVNMKIHVLEGDKKKSLLVDGGFATEAEVETAKST